MKKERLLRKKALKRGYRAAFRKNPLSFLQIEKVVKKIGRTLSQVFAKESAYLSTRKALLQNSLYEEIEELLLMSEEEFLKRIVRELEYCSDRWSIIRYRRFTFFIKKFKQNQKKA